MKQYRADELIEPNGLIHLFQSTPQKIEATHHHDFIEIVYVQSGSAEEYVDDARYEVFRGDLIWINCGSTHRFVPHDTFSFINICFKPELFDRLMLDAEHTPALLQLTAIDDFRRETGGMISFDRDERAELEQVLAHMLAEYRAASPYRLPLLSAYMNILLCRILQKTENMRLASDEGDVWQELLRYIDENPNADLTLSALARKCFYNPSYFSRVFKERFGVTLTEYVTKKKLERAERLLCDTSLPISDIAERAGFSSPNALYRASLKLRGVRFSDLKK